MRTIMFGFVLWCVAIAAHNHQSVETLKPSDLKWAAYCQQKGIDPEHAGMSEVRRYASLFKDVQCYDILMDNDGLAWLVYCNQYGVNVDEPTEEQENYYLDVWLEGEVDVALEK